MFLQYYETHDKFHHPNAENKELMGFILEPIADGEKPFYGTTELTPLTAKFSTTCLQTEYENLSYGNSVLTLVPKFSIIYSMFCSTHWDLNPNRKHLFPSTCKMGPIRHHPAALHNL